MWFFIPGHVEHLKKMGEKKISAVSMEIQSPINVSGIAFPEEDADGVFSFLNINPEEIKGKIETDMEGVVLLDFNGQKKSEKKKSEKKKDVAIIEWTGEQELKRYFSESTKKILLSALNQGIEIYALNEKPMAPLDDGVFRIFIHSTHPGNKAKKIETPRALFGEDVGSDRSKSYQPYAEIGVNFVVYENRYVVAELIGSNLYIHYNLSQLITRQSINIYEKILKSVSEYLVFSSSQQEEVLKNIVKEFTGKFVRVSNWDASNSSLSQFTEIIRTMLIPIVDKNIVIHCLRGRSARPVEDGEFHIFFWSGPENNGKDRIEAPDRIFKIGVDYKGTAFQPFDEGENCLPIYDDQTGYSPAELIGDNLFIHHHITYSGKEREIEIFKRIIENIPREELIHPEKRAERRRQKIEEKKRQEEKETARERAVLAEMSQKAKPLYVEACFNRLGNVIKQAENEIKDCNDQIHQHSREIISAHYGMTQIKQEVKMIQALGDSFKEQLSQEYELIINTPGVIGIDVGDDQISVYTEMIRIPLEERQRLIGQFRIDIRPHESSDGSILRFINISNWGYGPGANPPEGFDADISFNRHHPYVDRNGIAQLGDLEADIAHFIGENQIAMLIQILLQFLHRVDLNSYAGRGLKFWPIEEEVAVETDASTEKEVAKVDMPEVIKTKRRRRKKKINKRVQ